MWIVIECGHLGQGGRAWGSSVQAGSPRLELKQFAHGLSPYTALNAGRDIALPFRLNLLQQSFKFL
jgi:hypothetical protein